MLAARQLDDREKERAREERRKEGDSAIEGRSFPSDTIFALLAQRKESERSKRMAERKKERHCESLTIRSMPRT